MSVWGVKRIVGFTEIGEHLIYICTPNTLVILHPHLHCKIQLPGQIPLEVIPTKAAKSRRLRRRRRHDTDFEIRSI